MKKKGKAIGIVLVAALLVGLTIGSSMAETLFYYPVPGETWIARTSMWGTGSSHTSRTITLGDALIDEIGVHGWLYNGGPPPDGKIVDEDEETNYDADRAEVDLYSSTGADYAEADHTFEAHPHYWYPSTSDS